MPFYVYILKSDLDGTFYKGSTQDPVARLQQHNQGLSHYTASRRPWKLIYLEEMNDKTTMLIRERKLKRGNSSYFEKLIASEKNIVRQFFK